MAWLVRDGAKVWIQLFRPKALEWFLTAISHTPHPFFSRSFVCSTFKTHPKYDFLPPSSLPLQTRRHQLTLEWLHWSLHWPYSDLPMTLSCFTSPFFTYLLPSWLPWNSLIVPGMLLSSGSCSSFSLCMEYSGLEIHLQTPSPPSGHWSNITSQWGPPDHSNWNYTPPFIQIPPNSLYLVLCFPFRSTYFISPISCDLLIFNAYCLSVTLDNDLCVFCSQTHPKCLGKVLGTQQVVNICTVNGWNPWSFYCMNIFLNSW